MDGRLAIHHNHAALKRILAALVAMAAVPALSRRLRTAVLRLLRPAESATRRLIVALAPRHIASAVRRAPPDFAVLRKAAAARLPGFPLLDPPRRPMRRRPAPRSAGVPRISVPGLSQPFRAPPPPSPDDRIDAARLAHRLAHRLAVLGRVLDDLPAQARRLARWQARNALRPVRRGHGLIRRLSPLRVGRPPGAVTRGRRAAHAVQAVLASAQELALEAWMRRDSS